MVLFRGGSGVSVHDPRLAREDENADSIFSRTYASYGRVFIAVLRYGIICE